MSKVLDMIKEGESKLNNMLDTITNSGREPTAEEESEMDKLMSSVEKYKKMSVIEDKLAEARKDAEKPVNTVPLQPVVSRGGTVAAVNIGTQRETLKPWDSHGEFFRAVANASEPNRGGVDARLFKGIQNASGMTSAVGSDGGFLVSGDTEEWLMKSVNEESQLFSRITKYPVSEGKNGMSIPYIEESSRADGSRSGGVLAYWTGEGESAEKSKPKLGSTNMKLSKLLAYVYTTDEIMEDARSLEAILRREFSKEISFKLDDAIYTGSGNGQPLGILNGTGLVTVAKESAQTADTVNFDNIKKMWSRLAGANRRNAVWLINQEVEPELFSLSITVGTGGVPVYMPANGISGQPYSTLFGKPVLTIEQASKLGDVGDICLCDLSDYIGIDKGGLTTDTSIHVRYLYDEGTFRFRYRFNGTPHQRSAVKSKANSSFTISPYVTLAAR